MVVSWVMVFSLRWCSSSSVVVFRCSLVMGSGVRLVMGLV